MTGKPSTYWTAETEKANGELREKQLELARNVIVAGIEMAFQVTGSGLAALQETEIAMGAFLEAHNAPMAAEIAAIKTEGSA
ncbi:hypothetical protein FJ527_26460 [Mesorhizobium sp. B2-4-18]|uniref:hypothetical protein n=1 Tax=Mesorhizobium sp. B2-4-18 TaxID=2589931 RepID=UPI00112ABBD7|nr:hypothetical protein [Mesorhizobium sp. B2-4-18]TPK71587.1 hypothetical protein FJ527_26460 [Mesorhizobium sp. B2-4-18]